MPIRMSVPLPGPFRWQPARRRRHRRNESGAVLFLKIFFVWPFVGAVYVMIGTGWALAMAAKMIYAWGVDLHQAYIVFKKGR